MKVKKLVKCLTNGSICNVYEDGEFMGQYCNREPMLKQYGNRKIEVIWSIPIMLRGTSETAVCITLKTGEKE